MKSRKLSSILDNFKIFLTSIFADKPRLILVILILIIFIISALFVYNNMIKPFIDKKHILNKEFLKKSSSGNKEHITIIMFVTEWCPYCKKAKPEWDKFSQYVNNLNNTNENYEVSLLYVDCDKDSKTADKYNIKGYPTIKLIKNDEIYDYDAKPNKDTLVQFLESNL